MKKIFNYIRNIKGFTIIEFMIAIAIIGVFLVVTITVLTTTFQSGQKGTAEGTYHVFYNPNSNCLLSINGNPISSPLPSEEPQTLTLSGQVEASATPVNPEDGCSLSKNHIGPENHGSTIVVYYAKAFPSPDNTFIRGAGGLFNIYVPSLDPDGIPNPNNIYMKISLIDAITEEMLFETPEFLLSSTFFGTTITNPIAIPAASMKVCDNIASLPLVYMELQFITKNGNATTKVTERYTLETAQNICFNI